MTFWQAYNNTICKDNVDDNEALRNVTAQKSKAHNNNKNITNNLQLTPTSNNNRKHQKHFVIFCFVLWDVLQPKLWTFFQLNKKAWNMCEWHIKDARYKWSFSYNWSLHTSCHRLTNAWYDIYDLLVTSNNRLLKPNY